MKDHAAEYERLSDELYQTLSSVSKPGFIRSNDGAYFDGKLVARSLLAAEKALVAEPSNDLLRLARAMLLRSVGELAQSEADATFLVARGGEIAKAARVLLEQLRAEKGAGHAI